MLKKLLIIIFALSLFTFHVHAATAVGDICNYTNESYGIVDLIVKKISIKRTVMMTAVSTAFSGIEGTEGASVDDILGCEGYVTTTLGINAFGNVEACKDTPTDICDALMNRGAINKTVDRGETLGSRETLLSARVQAVKGSILGLSYAIEDVALEEPLAVNFAYFWTRNVEKLPIVGKTFAAIAYESGYRLPLLNAAYSIWELARNVALGLMSVVLLYTGLMIIMRKRVNPQLVVSVQYAIPKIVIGLLLIIFSYPIGSVIVGVSWGLYRGAYSIIQDLGGLEALNGASGVGPMMLAITVGIIKSGVGLGALLLFMTVAFAMIILNFAVYIKAVLIYLKMVLSVITAPLEMALGTVPGSEGKIADWFKRMAKMGLTIFVMGLVVPITIVFAYMILLEYTKGKNASPETGGFGIILRVLVPPLIMVYGFSLALGMEKTIASLFGDDKKFKRK